MFSDCLILSSRVVRSHIVVNDHITKM